MGYCFLYKRGGGGSGGSNRPVVVKTVLGSVISLTDSTNGKLKGMRIFGKTIQNGTPSPTTPVPLESVGDDGNVGVTAAGKNLIDFSKITTGYEINSEDGDLAKNAAWYVTDLIEVVPNTRYTVSGTSSLFRVEFDEEGKRSRDDAQSKATFRTGAKTKYVRFNSKIDGYSTPQLEIGSTATAYEPYKETQSATFSTPNGLPGIPVSSGGNYIDESGQMWVCDEIDFARGKYVQRLAKVDLSTFSWRYSNSFWRQADFAETIGAKIQKNNYRPIALCNTLAIMTWSEIASTDNAIAWMRGMALIANGSDTVPPTGMLYCELKTPIEKPLSAEELAQYAALHTNYPNTTIYNDEGAGMEVKYTSGG